MHADMHVVSDAAAQRLGRFRLRPVRATLPRSVPRGCVMLEPKCQRKTLQDICRAIRAMG
jgi:hypothetical protein